MPEMSGEQEFACRKVLLGDVLEERLSQHWEWGEQSLSGPEWLAVLMEEVGEAARAVLRQRVVGEGVFRQRELLRAELVQVAAVAVQWVEALDREVEVVR